MSGKSKSLVVLDHAGECVFPDDIDGDGWILADASSDSSGSPPARRVSGIFFRSATNTASFAPFNGGNQPIISFCCPPTAQPVVSSCGLLLLCSPWSSYYIVNPATSRSKAIALPRPPVTTLAAVISLVIDPNNTRSFYVVAAFEEKKNTPTIAFHVFSSSTWQWSTKLATDGELTFTGGLILSSGLSVGNAAYFRMESGFILAYDTVSCVARTLAPPRGWDPLERWEIGEAGGRLCCARMIGSTLEMFALAGPKDEWVQVGLCTLGESDLADCWDGCEVVGWCLDQVCLLKFQGNGPEAMLLYGGRVVGIDMSTGSVRETELGGGEGLSPENCVPHIVDHKATVVIGGGFGK